MGKFCVHCGNELDADSKFCTNCGAPVGSPASTISVDKTARMPIHPAELDATKQENSKWSEPSVPPPPIGPAYVAVDPLKQPSSGSPNLPDGKKPSIAVIILIVVVVLLLVALGIVLAVTQPWNSNEPKSTPAIQQKEPTENGATQEDKGEATNEKEESQGSEETSTDSFVDEDTYQTLLTYYDNLSGYDVQVRECATNFNDTYLKEDYSVRSSTADDCYGLLGSLMDEYDALQVKGASIPASSKYYATYQDISTLYYCLINRTSVIAEAWNLSLRYAIPADHQDEITAPIARDNVGGINKYKTQYDELYPKAKPEK